MGGGRESRENEVEWMIYEREATMISNDVWLNKVEVKDRNGKRKVENVQESGCFKAELFENLKSQLVFEKLRFKNSEFKLSQHSTVQGRVQ